MAKLVAALHKNQYFGNDIMLKIKVSSSYVLGKSLSMRRRAKLIKSFPNQISNKCNLNGSIWGDMQLYQLYMWCTFIDLFKWTPSPTIPRAGLLTVLTYYVVLDTSTSPPKNLKIVTVSISMTLCRKLEPIVITSKSPSVSTSSY